jgi:tRNA (guanosine-2'-O-)-methyltransferase
MSRSYRPADKPAKTSRFPRTGRRQERVRSVLARRQPDLAVVLEDVHDPHNASAVLRSCDAVGVMRVHLVYVRETPPKPAFSRTVSGSAAKWLELIRHRSIEECYAALRADGLTIYATALAEGSRDLYATDLTGPVALVFGNEHRGVSPEAVAQADGSLIIPMMGMVQSLNISVACAVTLYEALRQRDAAGQYEAPKLDDAALAALEEQWIRK